jgi:RNA polymerase sigma-70 factor, ECF subfamily
VREITYPELHELAAYAGEVDVPLQMDEEAFRGFYERTARTLWAYLARVTGDRQVADDLLQETYYRFLRASTAYENDAHRRNALFHIATNLVRDSRRRAAARPLFSSEPLEREPSEHDAGERVAERTDVRRAMQRLKPRERMLLWLAYAEGESHRDIAAALGVKPGSVKLLLFRARRRLAALLGGGPK